MKPLKDVRITIEGLAGAADSRIEKLLKTLSEKATESDDRCRKCGGTGKVYGDPDHPEKGVLDCNETECVKKRREEMKKQRPVIASPQAFSISDAEDL